ncbi:transporter substrate-binding domain-containing diguanylate cyclase [Aliikangiella coralliicola]|uniref:diguanylate cyclase n=1 Tax=Aliikangiella coralliicola TaxID=2592383 RepID=A0A545UDR4_9GAMM|nr:GGDEF domain-containing protein [Aliikangiella coralliicola]TQV87589.1 GGDEF domain-containing protein [Aliikangiella coralliicola]
MTKFVHITLLLLNLALISMNCLVFAQDTETSLNKQPSSPSDNQPLYSSQIFTPEERALIDSNRIFKVCNVIQQASNDASIGIVSLIANKSGLQFEATPLLSWAKSLEGLKTGRCDILPWATKTEARSKLMNFTRPYVRIKRVVVAKKQEPYIRDLDEVSDKIFAMLKSNYAVTQVRKTHPNVQFVYVDTVQDEIDYILQDKAYGTIVSLYSAANLFNNEQVRELKVVGVLPPIYDDIASLATRREDSALHNILEKSLIATNPRLIEEFMTEGAVVSYDPDVDYQKYWGVAVSVIFVVLILVWWNRYLKTLNAKLTDSQRKLELLSVTDPLTNVYNRLKMDEAFTQEIEKSKRYHSPLSVIMLDVDHFKNINDEYGHVVGDGVLKKIAQTIQSNLRTNDFLGRWGGEEFLIICPSTDIDKAQLVAKKLRSTLANTEFSPLGKVTASFGVAGWENGESQESIISRADSALYRAKDSGRNKVCI